jgi:beta-galactosidase
VDTEGLTVPRSNAKLRFRLEGPAEIAAVDNGDPTSFEPFQASERSAFNGLALVVVRALGTGTIRLVAESDGLAPARATLSCS